MAAFPSCRACSGIGLQPILDLGRLPLANALLTAEQLEHSEERFPLVLVFCPACGLVQITETVPPETLFRHYFYFSSFSDTVQEHARQSAAQVIRARRLDGESLVLEIASNDGYLLQHYHQAGVPVLGIEPAVNIARVAQEQRGIRTMCAFFGHELARRLHAEGVEADVIHASNVLAHVADLNGVVEGICLILKPGGIALIEVPYVRDMIERVEFDTIYHEHLSYFSLTSLRHLMQAHGLIIADVEHLPIHGGSLRLHVEHVGHRDRPSQEVERMLRDERDLGVATVEYFQQFGTRVASLREELVGLLRRLRSEGHRIAAYGASAKGATLLNCFEIGRELLDFVVDRSTVKQNHYTPGTHLPIFPPEKLLEEMPTYALLLTWNFAEEILQQQQAYRLRGGRFILPIPRLQVV